MHTNLFSRWTTRFIAALMIALLALAAMPASPAYAAGVVGTGTPASCTEAAFDAALAGGGAVTFDCGGAATINITTTKTISANTNINGENGGAGLITLDAGGGRRHFLVNAGVSLGLSNLTIQNGSQTGGGGAIDNSGDLTISSVTFTNNRSTGNNDDGGAIEHNAGTLTISNNSAFTSNYCGDNGGAIYIQGGTVNISGSTFQNHNTNAIDSGGAIYITNGTVTISDSAFSGNRAQSGGDDGGAIYLQAGTLTISDSDFTGNIADDDGGAIHKNGGSLTIDTNSLFDGNYALDEGGAIYTNNAGNLTIHDSTFRNHTNTNIDNGGAIYANNGTVNIARSTFTNNRAQSNGDDGGAIYFDGGSGTVADSTFTNNIADDDGGAIFTNVAITVTGSTFDGNTATGDGGAIYRGGGTVTITNSTFYDNTASLGGAVRAAGGTTNISFSSFSDNTATAGNGSDVHVTDAGTSNLRIFHSYLVNPLTTSVNCFSGADNETITSNLVEGNAAGGNACGAAASTAFGQTLTLADNGGPTQTLAISAPPPADWSEIYDAAGACTDYNGTTVATDQRGIARPQDTGCDRGAFELEFLATTLTADPATGVYGGAVDLSAILTSGGSGVSGRTVAFSLNGANVGSAVTNASGVATLNGVSLAGIGVGTYPGGAGSGVEASFAGGGGYAPSSGAADLTVNQAATTTTITGDAPDPSTVGQAVTVNYTVAVTAPGSGTPTGNVTVSDGTDSCTGTVAAGTCNLTLTTPGSRTLTATYSGDANFSGSTSAGETHQVNQISTTTAITSDAPDASVVGQAVTVTYTVTPGGAGTPSGNVTVSDGADSCTGTVAAGNCSLTLTTAGGRTLTATYAGDANFSGSTSAGEPHTVNQAATTTSITSDAPEPSVVGQAVTVNYTVAVTAPGSGTPTGNVTVTAGADSCTGTVAAGSCNITFTSAGSTTLTAVYAGNANFSGSTSAAETHQVNQAATTTTIDSDAPDPSSVGQAVPVDYTVAVTAPGSGAPTGNVTVTDGADSCTAPAAAGTCNITFTSIGAKTLTASYAGDANFSASTSVDESHQVNQSGTTTAITSDAPDPSLVGTAVTVTYTVTPGGAGIPTGNVTVTDGTDSCTGALTAGAGTCDITLTTAGPRTLTAEYMGDTNFGASTSAGEPHTVNASPAFLPPDNTTFTIGSLSVFTINTSGYPAPTISHTSGALPAGILFTGGVGSATLSGTPDPGTAGPYTLIFTASNGISPDATQTFTLTIAGGPTIVTNGVNTLADTGDGHLDEGETVAVGLSQILVTFNKDVNNPTPDPVPPDPDDVTNPANYLLVSDNGDGIQTYTCDTTAPGGGVTGGDTPISVDSVIYTNNSGLGPFLATLNINGGTALPDGAYRLIVCGTTSIVDLGGLSLAGNGALEGTDFTRNFRVAIPAAGGGGGGGGGGRTLGGGFAAGGVLIPVTGFAPGRVTDLGRLPVTGYHATGGATLEIPALKLKMPIVGVPFKDNTWDVNWLLNQAGWLEGSAFPGFDGNSVLTSHVTLPYGQAGPFAELHKLKAGDKIFVRAFGYLYVYEIESVSKASASDPSILQHEDDAWLTLITCADYNEIVEAYLKRLVVKARLVQTQTDLRWPSGR
ncbi:MAG: sortase [Chloroflexota bacterium]